MKNVVTKSLLVAAALSLGGCTTRFTEFTALSTKNVSIKGERSKNRVTGRSCSRFLLGWIPLSIENMKDAIDSAIESAGPGYDALEDGVVSRSVLPLLVYNQGCIEVTGTAIKTKEGSGAGSDASLAAR